MRVHLALGFNSKMNILHAGVPSQKAVQKYPKKSQKIMVLSRIELEISADSHPQTRKYPRGLSAEGPKSEVEKRCLTIRPSDLWN